MTSPELVSPSSLIRRIVFAWLAYAVLWIFALTGALATHIWAAPLFGLVLIAAFLATVVVTVRAFLHILRCASTPRSVLIITVLSTMGVFGQLWLMTSSFRSLFNPF
ncbi:MAG TPA: hypothetical protein VJN70_02525 [Gemmatimonadaceae bacterium]|nr:hypothetical protein [Gemmatimonadaceae bacterium]